MDYQSRAALYQAVEKERGSKVITFVTSDRPGLQTQIARDAVDLFVILLDKIGPTKKLSLILHTDGGETSAAWRLVNLLRAFCDELEVIVPAKAMSAGTLMCLGADRILMTKQAALGPIDPSLTHALGPQTVHSGQALRVPVSVEAVRGYLDEVRKDVKSEEGMAAIWQNLAGHVHPLVLGEIFRTREQIRFLARELLGKRIGDEAKTTKIIDFLCADSGSHDYTINRREAASLGLPIEKPSAKFYGTLSSLFESYVEELQTLEPYNPQAMLAGSPQVQYSLRRGLIETAAGGCYGFVSDGELSVQQVQGPMGVQLGVADHRTFEGWRKLA